MDLTSKQLQDKAREIIQSLTDIHGLELVDVEFIGRHRGAVIRIYIDSDKGVTLEDCGTISREASERFDQEETFDQAYTLEVSSPGVDRPFRNTANYRRNLDKKIDVVLTEPIGKATFVRGILKQVDDEGIVVTIEKSGEMTIPFAQIKRASRTLEF